MTDAASSMRLGDGSELVVPGSISNLGPGFDALSVAVQLYIRVRVMEILPDAPGRFEAQFVDCAPGGQNRIEVAFRHAAARGKHKPREHDTHKNHHADADGKPE